jgi:hypothetical protein
MNEHDPKAPEELRAKLRCELEAVVDRHGPPPLGRSSLEDDPAFLSIMALRDPLYIAARARALRGGVTKTIYYSLGRTP